MYLTVLDAFLALFPFLLAYPCRTYGRMCLWLEDVMFCVASKLLPGLSIPWVKVLFLYYFTYIGMLMVYVAFYAS